MFEREYRDLSYVPRWGIIPTTRTQSVAEHSYYVCLYTDNICNYMGYDPALSRSCLSYAVIHDRDECFMSDIPGPVKRSIKDPTKFTEFVKSETLKRFDDYFPIHPTAINVVKVADLMDEVGFWHEQQEMGNHHATVLLPECEDRLLAACQKLTANRGTDLFMKFMSGIDRAKIIPRENSDVAT